MIAGIIAGATAFSGALLLVFYLVRWARSEVTEVKEGLSELRTQDSTIAGLRNAVADRNDTIDTLRGERDRLKAAVAAAKVEYDEIVSTLASGADPSRVRVAVNAALERLSKLSETSTDAPAEDR